MPITGRISTVVLVAVCVFAVRIAAQTPAPGSLKWSITDTIAARELAQGDRVIQPGDVTVLRSSSGAHIDVALSDHFHLMIAFDPQSQTGLGIMGARDDMRTFSWKWFVFDRWGHGVAIQNGGEVQASVNLSTSPVKMKLEFLSDVSVDVSQADEAAGSARWRIDIRKGSSIAWADPAVGATSPAEPARKGRQPTEVSAYVKDLRIGAESGSAAAQYELGDALWNGRGIAEDDVEAVRWYRKAAEQGFMPAERRLGLVLGGNRVLHDLYGSGPRENLAEAAQWFRKAAEQGDRESMMALGYFYWNGKGVSQNWSEGTRWYARDAEENGDTQAMDKLSWAYFNGKGVEKNAAEAYRWLKAALLIDQARGGSPRFPPETTWTAALKTIAADLKPDQVAAADKAAQDWVTEYRQRKK